MDLTVLRTDILRDWPFRRQRAWLSCLLVERGLKFVDRALEIGAGAEFLDELERGAHFVEWGDLEDFGVVQIDYSLVLILLEQGFEDLSGLRSVAGEDIAFADTVGTFAASEGTLIESDVADEVEGVELLADFGGDGIEREARGFEFFDDCLFAVFGGPAFEELVEAGEAGFEGFAGVVAETFGDEFAVFVEVFDAFGDDGCRDAIDVDFAAFAVVGRDFDVGGVLDGARDVGGRDGGRWGRVRRFGRVRRRNQGQQNGWLRRGNRGG